MKLGNARVIKSYLMGVITYPCNYLGWTIFGKGASDHRMQFILIFISWGLDGDGLVKWVRIWLILNRWHTSNHPLQHVRFCIHASVNWVIISTGNGLALVRRQAITWTYASLLSIGLLGMDYCELWIGILSFSFKKRHLNMSSAKMAAIVIMGRWVDNRCNADFHRWWPSKKLLTIQSGIRYNIIETTHLTA